MGQFWKIVNIDKLEGWDNPSCFKMGELFYRENSRLMKCLVSPSAPIEHPVIGSWAGDRIICVGDYARDLPPGVITEDNVALLEKLFAPDHEEEFFDGPELARRLYLKSNSIVDKLKLFETDPVFENNIFPPDAVWALRNITKKEFIRSDVTHGIKIRAMPEAKDPFEDVPGLFQILLMRTGWSEDDSSALYYNEKQYSLPDGVKKTMLNEGAWAGDRLDIVMFKDESSLEDEGWKDVSEEAARQMKEIFECQEEAYQDFFKKVYSRRLSLRSEKKSTLG